MMTSHPHGLMFHHFHGGRHPASQGSIAPETLEEMLHFVGVHRILSPQEWMDRLAHDQLEPHQLCLTFDDGLLCQFELALPVLERLKLKAFWFVSSGACEGQLIRLEIYRAFRLRCFSQIDAFYAQFFEKVRRSPSGPLVEVRVTAEEIRWQLIQAPVFTEEDARFRLIRDRVLDRGAYERLMDEMIQEAGVTVEDFARDLWMTNDHLRQLTERGHVVGLHSYSHPTMLASLPVEEQRQEYERNYQHLERVCGQAPVSMAHPCNSYSEETLAILKQLGMRCGFRAFLHPPRPGSGMNSSPLELAREDHVNVIRRMRGTHATQAV